MQTTKNQLSPTKIELTVVADQAFIDKVKDHVLGDLAKSVSITGFRKGHAPKAIVEKNANPETLNQQFLDHAVNDLYIEAIEAENIRPVTPPDVNVTKFVPFTALEFKATIDVIGKITLPDYKKIKMTKKLEPTTAKDVDVVLDDLRRRDAVKTEVKRAAKDGDEVVIDFKGIDTVSKKPISGGTGTDYPIVLGSHSFIEGFEPEIVGMKPEEEKTFDITFPEDYGVKDLQGKKASFTVTLKTIREIELVKLDDEFASKVGPFKTVAELKTDIKKQLEVEKETQAQRTLENNLSAEIAEKATADIPDSLVDDEIERMEEEERRNLVYRGMTWQEHLDTEGKTAEQHREDLRESAHARVKTGLVLGEVAEAEGIKYTDKELNDRIAELKSRYNDKQMQSELDKPENRRELGSRLLTEKTVERLVSYAASASK